MDRYSDNEDERWLDGQEHAEFVLDESREEEDEVTYRRADFAAFMTTSQETVHDTPFDTNRSKELFSMHSGSDMDHFFSPKSIPAHFSSSSVEDPNELPMWQETGFHCVNPSFQTTSTPEEVKDVLLSAFTTTKVDATVVSNWKFSCKKVMQAEEIDFTVDMHRLTTEDTLQVDFNLHNGSEMLFLHLSDDLKRACRTIDMEMKDLSDVAFDLLADWSGGSSNMLFDSCDVVDTDEIMWLLEEILSDTLAKYRYETAKRLKEMCGVSASRAVLCSSFKLEFVKALEAMLQDDDEDVSRFAVFMLLDCAEDDSQLQSLELAHLAAALKRVEEEGQKSCTKELAAELAAKVQIAC